jgi:hypothetical protein
MNKETYTQRQKDAVVALREACKCDRATRYGGVSPARFALFFWPGKTFARTNGPWGLGPDASGRHAGKMLTRLEGLGLVNFRHYDGGYYLASLTVDGENLADSQLAPTEGKTNE